MLTPPAATIRRPTRSPMVRRSVSAVLLVGTAAAVTACSTGLGALPRAALGALVPFGTCDEIVDHLRAEAADKVGPYGLDGGVGDASMGGWIAAPGAAAAEDTASTTYSTTNNQEAGVDEADSVKTDGTYVYTTVDGRLRITRVDTDQPVLVGSLDLIDTDGEGAASGSSVDAAIGYGYGPTQLLLEGDHVLALVAAGSPWIDMPSPVESDGVAWSSRAALVVVDVSDPANPRETSRLTVDGSVVAARLVDGAARVVVRSDPRLPFTGPTYDGGAEWDDADWRAAEAAAEARNKEIVAESTAEQWLPTYTLDAGGVESHGLVTPCERISRPADFAGFSTTSVLTVPMGEALLGAPVSAAVLGGAETVYASSDRLYVSTTRWAQATSDTAIHAFDITGSGPAAYTGSGEVPGWAIGQYAFSEQDGVLRVATTVEPRTWFGVTTASESMITTLAERDGALVKLGSVDDLGKGEQIHSVRYLGDTAYVVTFRQTDPLYVVDLSDPAALAVTGELKITGYSAYLHPAGEGRLIGVGQEATAEGRVVGLQVSLFDTTDPASPAKIDGAVMKAAWASAEWDPHAFLYWEPTGQVVLPMQGERRSGSVVMSVTGDDVERVGMIRKPGSRDASWESPVRTLVVGDRLVTVWWDGVQTNDLTSLADLGFVGFVV